MPHNPFVVCENVEKDEIFLHLRLTGYEQDVMGAAKECSLRNIVMSVATPLAGLGKFSPLFIYSAV